MMNNGFRFREVLFIPLLSLFISLHPVFAEIASQAGETNPQALYKALEAFDFRNDAVLRLNGQILAKATANRLDDGYFDDLLKNRVPLSTLQVVAFVRNPELESMRQAVRARAEMYPQTMFVDALAEQYRSFLQGIETRTGGSSMKSGPELLFPGPGVLTFNGRLARLEVEMALEDYAMKLRDVAADLLTMVAEREMYRQSLVVMDKTIAVLGAFEESLTSRLSTGKIMYPELARLQSERQRMKNDRAAMQRMMNASLAGINRLLGRKPGALLGQVTIPQPAWSPENRPALSAALENRQEVRIQKISIQLLETLLALKTRSTLSPISPGFAYAKQGMAAQSGSSSRQGMNAGKERMDPLNVYKTTFDTGIAPLKAPDFGDPVSYLRELHRRIESEKAHLIDLENATNSEMTAALVDYDNAKNSSANERYRILPGLENALKSAETGYRTGEVSFLEWMELFMNTFSSRLATIRYDFEEYKAVGKILMLQGSARF